VNVFFATRHVIHTVGILDRGSYSHKEGTRLEVIKSSLMYGNSMSWNTLEM
jgi:hypothetical protein